MKCSHFTVSNYATFLSVELSAMIPNLLVRSKTFNLWGSVGGGGKENSKMQYGGLLK